MSSLNFYMSISVRKIEKWILILGQILRHFSLPVTQKRYFHGRKKCLGIHYGHTKSQNSLFFAVNILFESTDIIWLPVFESLKSDFFDKRVWLDLNP